MSQRLLQILKDRFNNAILEIHSYAGDDTAVVSPDRWLEIAHWLKDSDASQMDMLVDLCGVDYPDRLPRFDVVVHLRSLALGHRIRLKTRIGDSDGDNADLESLVEVWPAANWFERETYDMLGIRFTNHPDLRRILLYDDFEGHPLRKDYPANKTQPLVPYRQGPDVLDKLPPFHADEGMSFGRRVYEYDRSRQDKES